MYSVTKSVKSLLTNQLYLSFAKVRQGLFYKQKYSRKRGEESTVGEIYTAIFWFFRKRVVNISFLELEPVSNKAQVILQSKGVFTKNTILATLFRKNKHIGV